MSSATGPDEGPTTPSAAERSAARQAARQGRGPLVLGLAERTDDGDRRRAARWFWVTLGAIVVVIVIRLITITPPAVALTPATATTVRIPGVAPTPRWPSDGQAALAVPGVGRLGSSGTATATPTASLAKVMTAYLVLRRYPLTGTAPGFSVTITGAEARAEAADAAQDESVLPVRAGEILTEHQLLEGLLIPSGDNIARLLGAYVAGSDAAFVTEMNATARSLGMDHTHYTDPSGFAASTVSTAADQLTILERAMRSAVFRHIVAQASATLPDAGTVANYDPLIREGYAGKTGSDSAAEGCLAFFTTVHVHGRAVTVAGVVMDQGSGSNTQAILSAAGAAAQTLVDSIRFTLGVHTVLAAGAPVLSAASAGGQRTTLDSVDALSVVGWGGLSERLSTTHPHTGRGLSAGARVGSVRLAGSLPVAAGSPSASVLRARHAISAPGLGWRLAHLL